MLICFVHYLREAESDPSKLYDVIDFHLVALLAKLEQRKPQFVVGALLQLLIILV